ncbi:hypothetical protein Rmet_6626 (plasmid) [Cupriavidus metallidurans CH34]|uniref:Uncharacterized protein n=1 Tax=Cupriavidus metallidurans (strain ATCC 43123 / DSM 2839 / NBRC 102507 / CH34) TaxID=266264 RepID=D3DY57_CUPMC|nr:hypothetical protein Rmet_6626 [Cupriavidus metallidurans CH34]
MQRFWHWPESGDGVEPWSRPIGRLFCSPAPHQASQAGGDTTGIFGTNMIDMVPKWDLHCLQT